MKNRYCATSSASVSTVAMVGCEPDENRVMLSTDPRIRTNVASRHMPMRLIFRLNGVIQSKRR